MFHYPLKCRHLPLSYFIINPPLFALHSNERKKIPPYFSSTLPSSNHFLTLRRGQHVRKEEWERVRLLLGPAKLVASLGLCLRACRFGPIWKLNLNLSACSFFTENDFYWLGFVWYRGLGSLLKPEENVLFPPLLSRPIVPSLALLWWCHQKPDISNLPNPR